METHQNDDVCLSHTQTTLHAYVPRLDTHSALPANVNKFAAVAVVARALNALELPSAVIAAWRLIADHTEATAWHSSTAPPMNYRKAKDLARDLGVSDRHWRRIEVQLESAGVIYRATTENGFRGKAAGGAITFGLSLEPALAHFEQLTALARRSEAVERERKLCLGKIRELRKRLRSLATFDPLSAEDQVFWDSVERDYRPARPGFADQPVLALYLEQLIEVEDRLRARREPSLSFECSRQHLNHMAAMDDTSTEVTSPLPQLVTNEDQNQGRVDHQSISSKPTTSTKMSDAADSDVRCQYNLKYKIKHLNAEYLEFEDEKPDAAIKANHRSNKAHAPKNVTDARCNGGSDTSSEVPTGTSHPTLPSSYKIKVGQICRIFDHSDLLDDINAAKRGTPCSALDPQHIWDRFKRYNLKRDKQVLPVAALRAFIKGWLPDGQSYNSQFEGKGQDTQSLIASVAMKAAPPAPITQEEKLDFYIELLNSDRYIPTSMISNQLATELLATGRVTAEVFKGKVRGVG